MRIFSFTNILQKIKIFQNLCAFQLMVENRVMGNVFGVNSLRVSGLTCIRPPITLAVFETKGNACGLFTYLIQSNTL